MCEFNRSINFVKGLDIVTDDKIKLANNFRQIALLKKEIEAVESKLKSQLMEVAETVMLTETNEKVAYTVGRDKTSIDVMPVFKELKKQKRLTDFMSIVTLSKKSLESIEGGKVLSAKYTIITGQTKPSVSFKKMTKKEIGV